MACETIQVKPHPVARIHPVTGRKAQFVNENFTMHINELSSEESRAVLDLLFEHSTKPAFQVRFNWQPIRSPSGTIDRSSTSRCGTTSRRCVPETG